VKREKFQMGQGDKWIKRPSAMAWRPLTRSMGFSRPHSGRLDVTPLLISIPARRLVINKRVMNKKQQSKNIITAPE